MPTPQIITELRGLSERSPFARLLWEALCKRVALWLPRTVVAWALARVVVEVGRQHGGTRVALLMPAAMLGQKWEDTL